MKQRLRFFRSSFILSLSFLAVFPVSAQWSYVGGNISFNNTIPAHYSFAMDNADTLYVAFADNYNTYLVTVKKLVGGTWLPVGSPGFVSGSALFYHPGTSIAINPVDNSPYIAIADGDHGDKISVMKFNGSQWVYVGTPGFSAEDACNPKLVFTSTGTPYVSINDCYNGGTSVMRFTGGVWNFAGPQTFATGNYLQIAAAPDNTISVAFRDLAHESKISVMKFNGANWIYTGSPGFSDGEAESISITTDANNTPYVSYTDYSHSNKITVKKFIANIWTTLGAPSFSDFEARSTDISVNKYGVPYVTYTNPSLPVVKKYTNGAWASVGTYVETTSCAFTSILTDSFGNPYVLMALQPSSTLPFMKKYSPCNDAGYNLAATAALDSALQNEDDSTTVKIMASGGQAPYKGTGTFTVKAGYYTYTVTDGSGCTTSVGIDIVAPCGENYWTGNASTAWEDAANWSCGTVPGTSTVVYVTGESSVFPVITSIVTCKQLNTSPGVMVTIATGAKLNITGP